MGMQYAYSICDVADVLEGSVSENLQQAEYVYAGSYFCDIYFLSIPEEEWRKVFAFIRGYGKKAVLVIPTPSQRNLEKLKVAVRKLFYENSDILREVVVNDPGMLRWVDGLNYGLSIWCGRLMSKETRDPRYPEQLYSNKLSLHLADGKLYGVKVKGVELDIVGRKKIIEEGSFMISAHIPYAYITMGRYCEEGSVGRALTDKFRLWDACSGNCRYFWKEYYNDGYSFLKYGRAVYTKSQTDGDCGIHRVIFNGIADKIRESDGKKERTGEKICSC